MHHMEEINRRTWKKSSSLKYYGEAAGYETTGERILMEEAERRHAGGRVLDLGCGGGRTANLVKHFASDYLGVDYTPQLISIAEQNHPDLRFRHLDARDLSELDDGSFDLVLFSFNGIDAVDPEGRRAVLSEVYRVLAPGGSFAFSSFNRHWHGFDRSAGSPPPRSVWTVNPARMAARILRLADRERRRRRYAKLEQQGEHAILLHSAHDFGIMVYATTYAQLVHQLTTVGFRDDVQVMTKEGSRVDPGVAAETEYFHVMARK